MIFAGFSSTRIFQFIRFDQLGYKSRLLPYCIEIFAVAWLLSEAHFYSYLCARLLSLIILSSLVTLDARLIQRLSLLANCQSQDLFRAAAARVNLAYLLVSGALAIAVFSSVRFISAHVAMFDASFAQIMVWLVVGQSTSVFFGATTLLMCSVGQQRLCNLLRIITSSVFLFSLWVVSPEEGVLIAQMLAISQITHAGMCATILVKNGVWPGLTALFHKDIKIFK